MIVPKQWLISNPVDNDDQMQYIILTVIKIEIGKLIYRAPYIS